MASFAPIYLQKEFLKKDWLATVEWWLNNSLTGSVMIYHTGSLGNDRGRFVSSPDGLVWQAEGPVNEVAKELVAAFDAGKVHLFQRKVSDMKYDYLAVKASRYARNW
jgi:hypothetical protein